MLMVMNVVFLLLFISLYGVHSITINDARLSEGSSGTLEVLTHRGWQNLCLYYSWSSSESRVLCRQLGYDVTSSYPSSGYTSSSTRPTSLYFNRFSCFGSESRLSECKYDFNSERSSCSGLVYVSCTPCTDDSVQLRGGVVPEAGTVEYCESGSWKAVCDNNWSYKEAFVICRQLEFPATGAIAYQNSYFGDHLHPSDNYFSCIGDEFSLSSCMNFTYSTCNFANTAGVYCRGDVILDLCIDDHLRLVGGKDANEGRVEICSNGVWGSIYSGGWDSRDATVACKQLGLYQPYSRLEVFHNGYFGAGTGPILYAYLDCDGTELSLDHCSYASPLGYSFSHSSDAGVRCNKVTTATRSRCSNGDVRLINGTTPSEGRVEICYNGVWGSVCDNSWNDQDAAIVCLQMNFQGTNATALTGSYFGNGTGPYHLSRVDCIGVESTLLECSYYHSDVGTHACAGGHDAGIRCDASTCTHGDVRLFGGYTDNDGVAELCIGGVWADVCYENVTEHAVRSFCRQFIGTEPSYSWSSCCSRKSSTGSITLYDANNCTNHSKRFIQACEFIILTEICEEDLIVSCYEPSVCTNGYVRLRGGDTTREGRVEVCTRGQWGTVIQYYSEWDDFSASVVCKQLGYPWGWAIAVKAGVFGRSSTYYGANDFSCVGSERYLTDCSHSFLTELNNNYYDYGFSAGVICQGNTSAPPQCEHGDVRLVGGQKITEGRVEICAYGYWATVCYDDWGTVETDIVCEQLNFPTDGSVFLNGSHFGPNYDLPIVSISCGVEDNNISQCVHSIFNQSGACNHRNEIGIVCQERKQYFSIAINKYPAQRSHEIGSQVTLDCTVNHNDEEVTYYRWSSALDGVVRSPSHTLTTSVSVNAPNSIVYYCQAINGRRVLGTQRIQLDVKGLLQSNITGTNIQVRQKETFHLYVEPVKVDILNGLLGLTWYHNGSVIVSKKRCTISNGNKTLTIANSTFTDAGVYKVQFNQLFVHPFDENCKEKVLSLLRHLPVLRPAVFCVNMEGTCPDEQLITPVRTISIENEYSALKGTLNNITLNANGRLLSSKELQHSSILWYRNGHQVYSSLSLQKHYNNFSLSQQFQISNITYEQSGRYEVLLSINIYSYLSDHTCQSYYDRFVSPYLGGNYITLSRGYIDVGYYKGLAFDLDSDKESAYKDDGATLTCRASIGFPPFSTISFIKNGETVATSTSGQLQIDTKSVNANPFGLYICQLNASGVTFNKTIAIIEQANIRIKIVTDYKIICRAGRNISAIEDALVSKISSECHCGFSHNDLRTSSVDCNGNELIYSATIGYSSEDGSETASVITERIIIQVPFGMSVGGMPVTVTSACSDCPTSTSESDVAALSPADGGGLFIGGLATAAVVIGVIITVIVLILKIRHTKSEDNYSKSEQQTQLQVEPTEPEESVRYIAKEIKCSSVTEPESEMKTKAALQSDDYEATEVGQQDIYEETF